MAIHIIDNSSVARWGNLRFWADRGLIHIEDARDNSYKAESVRQVLLRAKALNDMKMKFEGDETPAERKAIIAERARIQRFIEQILQVAAKAREQGQPTDVSARNSVNAARTKRFVMPNVVSGENWG